MTTRRDFLGQAVVSAVAARLPTFENSPPRGFLDILRAPDLIVAQTTADDRRLTRTNDRWTTGDVTVETVVRNNALHVTLNSPTPIKRLHLRWRGDLQSTRLILGDAWERGYGDLEWRAWSADRVMPWYVAAYDGTLTQAYGVRTGAKAFCFWQIDPQG